ncbi:OmpA family protein [Antarctobacter jejuensis]|uniref:OmpA family protein n=1 Tax=Antarctobacter jejuensis TaxID=1439938 RepID=UPI003FD23216
MNTKTQPPVVKQSAPGLPRRAVIGAVLVALSLGGAAALGIAGAALSPASDDFFFSRGTSFAKGEEARLKAKLAELAADDRITLRITGHSGTQGDDSANLDLSEQRAEAARSVARAAGFPAERVDWVGGVGGGDPLSQKDGESDRAYQAGLARVTLDWQVRP